MCGGDTKRGIIYTGSHEQVDVIYGISNSSTLRRTVWKLEYEKLKKEFMES
jgi:hypothetical protein